MHITTQKLEDFPQNNQQNTHQTEIIRGNVYRILEILTEIERMLPHRPPVVQEETLRVVTPMEIPNCLKALPRDCRSDVETILVPRYKWFSVDEAVRINPKLNGQTVRKELNRFVDNGEMVRERDQKSGYRGAPPYFYCLKSALPADDLALAA